MTGIATPVKLRTYFASSLAFFCIVLQKCCKCCERKRAREPASIQLRQMQGDVESASAWIQHGSRAREGGHRKSGDGGLGRGAPQCCLMGFCLYFKGHEVWTGSRHCHLSALHPGTGQRFPDASETIYPGCSDWPSVIANPKSSVHWVSLD